MSLIFLARTGSPTISGTMCVVESITGRPASRKQRLSVAAEACCASRSAELALRCFTAASTPATSTGLSEVVKMKPGA
jgi:hypothetical protein